MFPFDDVIMDFMNKIFKLIVQNNSFATYHKDFLRSMPQNLTNEKSALV